jgi:hypothetical protein
MGLSLRILSLAVVATAVLLFPFSAMAGTEPVEPETPTVLDANEDEVAKVMEAVAKAKADKDDKLLLSCLMSMETHRADEFMPVISDCIGHKDEKLQTAALSVAASHEMRDESKRVLKILKKAKKKRKGKGKGAGDVSGSIAAAAIDYLARLAIEGADDEVTEHLTRLFLVETRMQASYAPDLVRAAVHYLGQMKTKAAVPQLVEMVREPYPENPNAASNPPASYWEARYKIWQASEGWVRWALKEITDKEFRTHREWAAWAAANAKDFK